MTPRWLVRCAAACVAGMLTFTAPLYAQSGDGTAAAASAAPSDGDKPPFKQEELDQMLAPLALYPDSLLSQVLMASTYPLEIVQADRWAKSNKDLKGDALAKALEEQSWDASVKSLVNFPDVLTMLSDKLDWTVNVGDAFIGQQKQVMDTIQSLRGKAQTAGNLESTKEQVVTVEPALSTQSQIITIESSSPDTVYVPAYNSTTVYGSWPYPSYPPYPYYPPGYVLGTAALSFGVGVACGAAWGYAWGDCDWGHGDMNIDVDRNTNFNTNINRTEAKAKIQERNVNRDGSGRDGSRRDGTGRSGGQGKWQHDGSHRQGTPYRNQGEARQFGGKDAAGAAKARDSYRGRAEAGRQDIARGGADQFRGGGQAGDRAGGGARPSTGAAGGARDRGAAAGGGGNRPSAGTSNRGGSDSRGGALDGASRGGDAARAQSSRGKSSRGSASGSRGGESRGSAGGGGGGSRSGGSRGGGGGGGRGGGGRGGGGRR